MTVTRIAAVTTFTPDNYHELQTIALTADPYYEVPTTREGVKIFPVKAHRLADIRGPLAVEGGSSGADRSLTNGVKLPGEADAFLFAIGAQAPESQQIDVLNIYNDGSRADTSGVLTDTMLSGFGMSSDLVFPNVSGPLHGEGPEGAGPQTLIFPGGISFGKVNFGANGVTGNSTGNSTVSTIEVVNLMLGEGNDDLLVEGTLNPAPHVSAENEFTFIEGWNDPDYQFLVDRTDFGGRLVIARDGFNWKGEGFPVGQDLFLVDGHGARHALGRITGIEDALAYGPGDIDPVTSEPYRDPSDNSLLILDASALPTTLPGDLDLTGTVQVVAEDRDVAQLIDTTVQSVNAGVAVLRWQNVNGAGDLPANREEAGLLEGHLLHVDYQTANGVERLDLRVRKIEGLEIEVEAAGHGDLGLVAGQSLDGLFWVQGTHGGLTVLHGSGNRYINTQGSFDFDADRNGLVRLDGRSFAEVGFAGGFGIAAVNGDEIVLLNAALGDCADHDGIATLTITTYDITRSGGQRVGGDHFIVTGGAGPDSPLVIYGDTSQDGIWYSGHSYDRLGLEFGPKPFDPFPLLPNDQNEDDSWVFALANPFDLHGNDLIDASALFANVQDGGQGDDLIFGDNVNLTRMGEIDGNLYDDIASLRFQTLAGTMMYSRSDRPAPPGYDLSAVSGPNSGVLMVSLDENGEPIARDFRDPNGPSWWSEYEIDYAEYHSFAVQAGLTGAGSFGNDYIAGGAGNDYIFGQLGNDIIQGDGTIAGAVTGRGNGTAGGFTPLTGYVSAAREMGTVNDPTGALKVVASVALPSDGSDYIEGGGGCDTIFGGLGQDDIVGGSSSFFSLVDPENRPDGGDMIFGGSGERIERNDDRLPGDGTEVFERHARDADAIIGDNGNIVRLVGINGTDLLTVLRHEIGHLLGSEHESSLLMGSDLRSGTRIGVGDTATVTPEPEPGPEPEPTPLDESAPEDGGGSQPGNGKGRLHADAGLVFDPATGTLVDPQEARQLFASRNGEDASRLFVAASAVLAHNLRPVAKVRSAGGTDAVQARTLSPSQARRGLLAELGKIFSRAG